MKINKNYTSYTHSFTSVNAIEISNLKVYPNPSENILNIELLEFSFFENSMVKILSMDGKLQLQPKIPQGESKTFINTEHLKAGIYMIYLNNGLMKDWTLKFIKK